MDNITIPVNRIPENSGESDAEMFRYLHTLRIFLRVNRIERDTSVSLFSDLYVQQPLQSSPHH